jgi:hypothetical protein
MSGKRFLRDTRQEVKLKTHVEGTGTSHDYGSE